jgi:hypothetical protein
MSTRKIDLIRFGLFGIVTFALVVWLQIRWLDVAAWMIGAVLLVFALVRRRWVPLMAFAGAHLLGVGLLLGVLFGTPAVSDYASRTAFDSTSWKAENRHGAEGIRVRMVDDLLRTHKLVGMSRAQLENLLGVPPATEYFREYDYVYWLGPERGLFPIDSEWLVVKCDHNVVVSAQVVTD